LRNEGKEKRGGKERGKRGAARMVAFTLPKGTIHLPSGVGGRGEKRGGGGGKKGGGGRDTDVLPRWSYYCVPRGNKKKGKKKKKKKKGGGKKRVFHSPTFVTNKHRNRGKKKGGKEAPQRGNPHHPKKRKGIRTNIFTFPGTFLNGGG